MIVNDKAETPGQQRAWEIISQVWPSGDADLSAFSQAVLAERLMVAFGRELDSK